MTIETPRRGRPLSDGLQSNDGHGPAYQGRQRSPRHPAFIGAGGVLLIAVCLSDYAYYRSALWQWANFSAWLLTVGLIVMLFSGVLLLIDFMTARVGRLNTGSFTLVVVASLLSLVNAFVHTRDAWTSVVPQGIILSVASAVLLLIAGTRGWGLATSRVAGKRTST